MNRKPDSTSSSGTGKGWAGVWVLSIVLLIGAVLLATRDSGDANNAGGDPTATVEGGVASTTTVAISGVPSGNQQTTAVSSTGGQTPASSDGTVPQGPLTQEEILHYQPNELGQIPILEYHHLGPEPEQFVRTPDQFLGDLQWLYDNNFYVINLHEILIDNIDVPAGKRPVALTFDDSPATQFSLIPLSNGQLAIDPKCAIGILELFFAQHPDFGRGGHFSVLPDFYFDWDPARGHPDQTPYIQEKFRWLVEHGYEIGNHTLDHANLSTLTDDEIKYQLAAANDAIHEILPDEPIEVITLPYGMYPDGGDDTLLRGFQYEGGYYEWSAALMVGANPTASPLSTEYDPYATARIQAFDEELDKWFAVFQEQPGILYVSDGDPNTVTIPEDLHPWLVGTLDISKIGDRELVRY
ncbi:MAG: polysaccharide deacetylase family protein [Thermomicrobiales bacterium]